MNICEEIFSRIKKDYESGITQEQIARKYNVDQQRINRILSGKRKVSGFSLGVIQKMFPHAEIHLDGAHNTSIADRGGVSVQDISVSGGNNNFFSQQKEVIKKITDAVMTSDLDPEAKVKVYNIIKENSEG